MENDEPIAIGDNPGMEIVRIGKTKSALKSQFSSTGNHHYDRNITFSLITLEGLKDLINIQMDYSTQAWDILHKDCNIRSYESTYQIIESDKEWFDIKIEKLTQIYSKDCLVKEEKRESRIYQYIDNEYKLIE
jgi:hypothetical protein